MSSYQFVNTLAQCYAEQQNAAAASAGAQTNQQMDYYNMNYPNSYSPNLGQNYNQYSLMMSGQAAAAMASMSASVASGTSEAATTYNSMSNAGQQATPQSQQRTSNHSPMNNCANKYEASGGLVPGPGGSPQDLRTSSETEGTPQPKTPSSPSQGSQPPLSPLLSSTTSNVAASAAASAAAAAAAVAAAAAAANSSTPNNSNSSNNVSGSGNSQSAGGSGGTSGNRSSKQNSSNSASEDGKTSSSSGGNPPQIYPWMKRAHLGQSKFPFTFL